MKILVGCDPEFFISKGGNVIWPTPDMFPGDKKNPYKVKCGAVQIDGAAIEINIDPAETAEEFDSNINTVLEEAIKILGPDFKLEKKTSHNFDLEYYKSIPSEYKKIGCDPDFNVHLGHENYVYDDLNLGTFRMVGGHIHVGWTENQDIKSYEHIDACKDLVPELDRFIRQLEIFTCLDDLRQGYYGRAGNYRIKPYGVEYRSPSNWWIWESTNRKLIFNQVKKAVKFLMEADPEYKFNAKDQKYLNFRCSKDNYKIIYSRGFIKNMLKVVSHEELSYLITIYNSFLPSYKRKSLKDILTPQEFVGFPY